MEDGAEYNYLQEREISIAEREDRDSKKEVNIRSLDDLDEDERKTKIEEIQEHKREAEAFPYHAKTSGPMLRSAGNTGPKSVKKDYEEAKERARLRVMKQNEESWKKIEQSALVHRGGPVIAQQPLPMPPPRREEEDGDAEDDEEFKKSLDEAGWDEEDEAFFKQYYQKKMEEMQIDKKKQAPSFGKVQEVTKGTYVKAIDNEDPRTFVVVHLYQPYHKECVWMNKCLDHLAKSFPEVKFLRIISTEAKAGYDDIALPTLILYREGKTLQTYVRVTDDLGSEFTAVDVQELLSLHGVLPWNDNVDSLNIRKKPTF